jgi:hypothetical protein
MPTIPVTREDPEFKPSLSNIARHHLRKKMLVEFLDSLPLQVYSVFLPALTG